jgi:flagellar hook-associated protein 1 FlgK
MITLTGALQTVASALRTDSAAIGITGQNLANQTTPGYAAQLAEPRTDGYDPTRSQAGGVSLLTGDARSQFAEQAVWYQQSQAGQYQAFTQLASPVSQVMDLNDSSGATGMQGTLSQLFESFATLAASPNSTGAQNGMIADAQAFAAALSSAATTVQRTVTSAQSDAQTMVSQINQLVGQVQQYNQQIQSGVAPSATAEAQAYSALESLSNLAPITTQLSSDGSISVMMNGSTPLLTGTQQFNLQANLVGPAANAAYPQGNPTLQIVDGQGQDVTGAFTGGQLGGLINYVNNFAPTLIGNGTQQGTLNQFAQGIANSVNGALGGSTPLFQYDSANPTQTAQSFQVNSSFTPASISSALTADPNAATNLANISAGNTAANLLNGQSFTDFLTTMENNAGGAIDTQQSGLTLHTQLLNQAQANRTTAQGVSLATESVNLIQYQQAFQAASEVLSVINTLTQNVINMDNVTPA